MWFKNIQILSIQNKIPTQETLSEQLASFAFVPCLPSLMSSEGWVSPLLDEGGPLTYEINRCLVVCLQVEEKILPASVIRKEVDHKVKELEALRDRKMSQKEKRMLKEEMTQTLLPKAFTRLSHIYAYIDTQKQRLIVNTSSVKKAQRLVDALKKTWEELSVEPLIDKKIAQRLTHWLLHREYPNIFAIEKSCVLIDPADQARLIRCQHQNLSDQGVQLIAKNGCEVKQMALSWQDKLKFMLVDDFSLRSIKFDDLLADEAKDMEPETKAQQFVANYLIMTETFRQLTDDLHAAME